MFGISWTEFLIILLVAICVVPAKHWPEVARFLARVVKYVRDLIWKINDFGTEMQHRLEIEKPMDDLISDATRDIFESKKKRKK